MRKFIIAALVVIAVGVVAFVKWDVWVEIPAKRKPLVATLKDGGSAEFRAEKLSRWGALCGEVNSKNSQGGYVGFTRYFVHGTTVAVDGEWPEVAGDKGKTTALIESLDIQIVAMKAASSPADVPVQEAREKRRRFDARWQEICN